MESALGNMKHQVKREVSCRRIHYRIRHGGAEKRGLSDGHRKSISIPIGVLEHSEMSFFLRVHIMAPDGRTLSFLGVDSGFDASAHRYFDSEFACSSGQNIRGFLIWE